MSARTRGELDVLVTACDVVRAYAWLSYTRVLRDVKAGLYGPVVERVHGSRVWQQVTWGAVVARHGWPGDADEQRRLRAARTACRAEDGALRWDVVHAVAGQLRRCGAVPSPEPESLIELRRVLTDWAEL